MADLIDRAQDLEQRQRATALARRRPVPAAGGGTCVMCGEPIAQERLAALPGAARCVECQNSMERHR